MGHERLVQVVGGFDKGRLEQWALYGLSSRCGQVAGIIRCISRAARNNEDYNGLEFVFLEHRRALVEAGAWDPRYDSFFTKATRGEEVSEVMSLHTE